MVRPGQATIAFTISFVDEDPKTAQAVVAELLSLYLAENARTRKVRASETTGFLANEAEKLAQQITELEANLAAFKQENAGSLPDRVRLNQEAINRIDLQLLSLRQEIQAQEERKVYLQSQLAQVSPFASITLDDGTVLRPEERLRKLQAEYTQLSNTYGPKHPTMVELSREMQALREKMGIGEGGLPDEPSNPAYIQLQTELTAVNSNLSSLRSERSDLEKRLTTLEAQNLKAPGIERDYLLMTRNYENATAEYRAVKEKLWEAQRLESIETERKGERFSVIEPPNLPQSPVAPQRRLLVLVGFMIAVVGGLGTAALAEVLDQTVSGPRHLAAITGTAPLVVIPYIEATAPRPRALGTAALVIIALTAAGAAGLIAVNEWIVPLESLWAGSIPGTDIT
jgi:polysaccharide chain length determinant protein (PEP-CTERM system associated)